MKRRDFVISGCGFCAALLASGVTGMLLESCAAPGSIYRAEISNAMLSVPSAEIQDKKYLVVRNINLEYDVLLVKGENGAFHALSMRCTHRQSSLSVTKTGLVCNEHGSRFDLDGKVLQDPATKPLKMYTAELNGQTVLINLQS